MESFSKAYDLLSSHDFLLSFWSNFLADILVAGLLAWAVSSFTTIFKRPALKMVVKQGGLYRNSVILSKRSDGDYEASFLLAVKNDGNQAVRVGDGLWHAYLTADNIYSAPGESNHQRGPIGVTVFPASFVDLTDEYKVHIKREDVKDAFIPYFFSTSYGLFPKTAVVDAQTGIVLFDNMNKIRFETLEDFIVP